MTTDDDFPICLGHITVRDYPDRQHPDRITVTVQCTRKSTHNDRDPEDKHFGWIMRGVHVEWSPVMDGVEFDADSPLINTETI